MTRCMHSLTGIAVVMLLLCLCRAAVGQMYTFTDLGALPGDTSSSATGINNNGQVVGVSVYATYHAFLWSASAGMTNIGTLGGPDGYVLRINDNAQASGWFDSPTLQDGWLWQASTGMVGIGTLGGSGSRAWGINNLGQEVGASKTASDAYHAFFRSAGGIMTDLGVPPGTSASLANGINDSDQIVGWGQSSGGIHAFLWQSGVWIDLGTLGGLESFAVAINDPGEIVGGADTLTYSHAFFRGAGGTMSDLGTLGGDTSIASDINNMGQVVGWSQIVPADITEHAFMWSSATGMIDLNSLLPPGSSWVLQRAYGMNDSGQIVGMGHTSAGFNHAFLLGPAIPKSVVINPQTVVGSLNATGMVTLLGAAPPGGALVTLTNTNPAAFVPASVTVPAGSFSVNFTIGTMAVTTSQVGTVTATYNGVSKSAGIKVRPIGVKSISLSPNPVIGGSPVMGTVHLEASAAPGSILVSLSSSNPAVANPTVGSITIPAGQKTGSFTVSTTAVSATTSVAIYAIANGVGSKKLLKINP